uniref:Uncharacterized conserved protein, DUF1015 family n=1 Tax=Candidatus Kentrum sp. DK TaxID=2126562 RepID=A0A450SD64_9GAMM|nr:MAG: Uncharacterized conserved protein, DUF1015 family [Candidatus Kentron sp. DK]
MKNHTDSPPLFQPFAALMPTPEYAAEVAAPPYDVVSAAEARALAEGNPRHFLHISRPEIDFPVGTDPYREEVYQQAAGNLARMIREGILKYRDRPCYYVYRLQSGDHVQTGIAGIASVPAYEAGRIRKHELTRPQKENDRVRHIRALDAQTGPVLLVCRASAALTDLFTRLPEGPPGLDMETGEGVRHSIWAISDPETIAAVSWHFAGLDSLYIADGHHRSAAAARVAESYRAANPNPTGREPYNAFLSVVFPEDQVRILDYNRVVLDLGGLSPAEFLARLSREFEVRESEQPVRPESQGEFGLYLPGKWYRLALPAERIPREDPVGRLDVSLLTDRLLRPILGIADLRRDDRIDFVGGIRGLAELERRVDRGDMAAAFSLRPTRISDLLAVADADLLMPPKSTWFEPKLADGLLSHRWRIGDAG